MFSRRLALVAVFAVAAVSSCSTTPPTAPTIEPLRATSAERPQPAPPTGGTTSIAGQYRMTITADPACVLPAEARQRSYTALIEEPQAGYITVTLSGAQFVLFLPSDKAGFDGTRDGNVMRLVIDNGYGGPYYFIERVDETKNLFYEGIATVTVGQDGIIGSLAGEMRYFVPGQRPWLGDCSGDHRIAFTR